MTNGYDDRLMTDDDGRGKNVEIKRTYSLVDVAEKLGRPRTTLADWARQFREFLPTVGTGRSMRYKEDALEVFGLISKMKDANEPPEYIREQLRSVVTEIIIPMTDDDDGKPYLMQLSGEVDQLKQAVVRLAEQVQALTTANDVARREAVATSEQLSERISNVSNSLGALREEQDQQNSQVMAELGFIGNSLKRIETHKKSPWWKFKWH